MADIRMRNWNAEARISYLRRHIIVHSLLYYEMDDPAISDEEYDRAAAELVGLCRENPEEAASADYFYCMHDFDGNTGFDICGRLTDHDRDYLMKVAKVVRGLYRKEVK